MFFSCAFLARRNMLICSDVHKGHVQEISFLRRRPETAINEAVVKLTHHDYSRSLLQHNQAFYRLIRDGVPVSYRDAQGALRHAQAKVIDFREAAEGA